MPKSRISYVANMSFNTIRENKILAKISEFTVLIQPVGVFSLNIHSVSSLKIQALNADKENFWAHPVDTEKWHCTEHSETHIDVC